jgi:ketosteroid isomerase-like protein
MSIEQDHTARVRAFFEALNRADGAAIADAYAEDGRCVTMGNTLISGSYGKAQVREYAAGILQVFPQGLRFSIQAMTAEGERVAVEAASEGRHVSGAMYTNQYHFLFVFRGGKIAEFKEYMDTERVTDVLCGGRKRAAAGT